MLTRILGLPESELNRLEADVQKFGLTTSRLPAGDLLETGERVRFEIPFDLIHKDHVRQGGLRAKYDVIVIGAGAAGLSAALVLTRDRKSTRLNSSH